MKRAVIITAPGFQDEELIYPYYRLLEAGFEVTIATKDKAVVYGKYGVPARATADVKDLREQDYTLACVPGGHEAPDRVRQFRPVLDFLSAMDAKGKVITSICHGPWVLISAGIMKGRKATCYVGCSDDLKNAGAEFCDSSVVVDRNIVTSPHYNDNPAWMRETLKLYEAWEANGGRIPSSV